MDYERILRRIRQHPALYGEMGAAKERQAERIRDKAIARLAPKWAEEARLRDYERGQRLLYTWA